MEFNVEVTFRYEDDKSWMRVEMPYSTYLECLKGMLFEGRTLRHILTECVEDTVETSETFGCQVMYIYDTFIKEWLCEYSR